jgi:hypothetical protein
MTMRSYEVFVDLEEVIDLDREGFLSLISELACGYDILTDISFKPVGTTSDGQIILSVIGDDDELVALNMEGFDES